MSFGLPNALQICFQYEQKEHEKHPLLPRPWRDDGSTHPAFFRGWAAGLTINWLFDMFMVESGLKAAGKLR
jgi:hypothetical protein